MSHVSSLASTLENAEPIILRAVVKRSQRTSWEYAVGKIHDYKIMRDKFSDLLRRAFRLGDDSYITLLNAIWVVAQRDFGKIIALVEHYKDRYHLFNTRENQPASYYARKKRIGDIIPLNLSLPSHIGPSRIPYHELNNLRINAVWGPDD